MAKNATIIKNRYDKAHMKQFLLKLHLVNDADIIEKFGSVPNMQGYVKQLVREDIARTRPEPVPEKIQNVKEGLEHCRYTHLNCCYDCPYHDEEQEYEEGYSCTSVLASDALEVIKKLESVPKSVPVSLSDASLSILTKKSAETGISVPDLISVMVNEQLIRT